MWASRLWISFARHRRDLAWRWWLSSSRTDATTAQNPCEACLQHLLSASSGVRSHERIVPFRELIQRWIDRRGSLEDTSEYEKALRENGMIVEDVFEDGK